MMFAWTIIVFLLGMWAGIPLLSLYHKRREKFITERERKLDENVGKALQMIADWETARKSPGSRTGASSRTSRKENIA